ncbi:hypothetical protein C4D60_Mb03t12330 [Musa balbisiana]|uniref:Uncharacterized protein n=1 Tax=Musa balbisiana TaxID=52838 RepID=A0A4S8JBT9_MUSBA|nr:hypothetical protein C4D60_Mb03t12330 [Musa balbisiana]
MGSSEDEWELLQRERVDADAAAAPPPTTCMEMRIKEENNQSAGQPRHRLALSPRWESRPIAFALLRWVAPSISFAGYRGPHLGRPSQRWPCSGPARLQKTGAWPPVGRSVDAAGVTSAGGSGSRKVGRCQLAAFLVGRGDTDRSWPDHRRPDWSAQGAGGRRASAVRPSPANSSLDSALDV